MKSAGFQAQEIFFSRLVLKSPKTTFRKWRGQALQDLRFLVTFCLTKSDKAINEKKG
jgi:hypothetical protein